MISGRPELKLPDELDEHILDFLRYPNFIKFNLSCIEINDIQVRIDVDKNGKIARISESSMGRSVSFEEAGGAGDSGVPDDTYQNCNMNCNMIVPGGNMDVFRYRLFGPVDSQRVDFIWLKVFRDEGVKREVSGLAIHFIYDANGTLSGMSACAECFTVERGIVSSLAVSVGQVKRGKDRIVSESEHHVDRIWSVMGDLVLDYPWV
jgi:hypothetical protein